MNQERILCPFYEAGFCKFGNKCYNIHQKDNKKIAKKKKVKKIYCEHFQRGVCAYGDSCFKIHEFIEKEAEHVPAPAPAKTEVVVNDNLDNAPVCEHFQRGSCLYGDTCFKKHMKMPLYKEPYGPKIEEVVENFNNIQLNAESPLDEIFLSDSEAEENENRLQIKQKKDLKKTRASPINLFEVLKSSIRDTSPSSSDESDKENDQKSPNENKVDSFGRMIKMNDSKSVSNAEKKRLKKENKKKQAAIATQKKIDTLNDMGNKEFKAGKHTAAVKLYTEAISLCGPNNPVPAIYNSRCAAFLLMDKFKSALKDGRKVVEFEPGNNKAHHSIVKSCLALGKVEEGRNSLHLLSRTEPQFEEMKVDLENIDSYHQKALSLADEKMYKSAVDTINKGLAISPYCSQFHTLKAKFLAFEKNIIGARNALEKLDMKDPNVKTSLYHFVNGLCYYYEDDLERAISGFAEARKELPEAKEWHDKAMAMHNAFVSGNKVLKMGGSYSVALASLDKGLALDKENHAYMAKLFYTRALLNTRYERLSSALSDCTSAIEYDSGHYKAWSKRGSLHLEMEKYAEAVNDLTEAYRLKSTPETLSILEDARRRKTKAERRKPSYYQILGVDKTASVEEIKKAYRAKAREFHPDKHANASKEDQAEMEAKMKDIAAANQCLSDSAKKLEYDRRLERMLKNDDSDMEESDDDDDFSFDVNDFFFHLFGIYVRGMGAGRAKKNNVRR